MIEMSLPLLILGQEWIILLVVVVLLFFGAKKIPELARAIGKSAGEFRKARLEAEAEIEGELKRPSEEKPAEDKFVRLARELGIDTEGKTPEQLKEEVKKALEEA